MRRLIPARRIRALCVGDTNQMQTGIWIMSPESRPSCGAAAGAGAIVTAVFPDYAKLVPDPETAQPAEGSGGHVSQP